ncbi:hypothetical protein [Catenuloplanes japonicus]|uniref:hypothetical protein n=1 Tax=Catenuloplanes japonicus TaxID=33876 RepID=UPI0005249570|nr:hypothetical protein [Catenuloplanes japonicus]
MTFAFEGERLGDLLPATLRHQHDESWECKQGCGEWPCIAYRVSIRGDYANDRAALCVLMAAYMLDFLSVRGGDAEAASDRFMRWCRESGRPAIRAQVG